MVSIRILLLVVCALMPQLFLSATSSHAQGIPQNIPRKEMLILENPEGTIKNAGWFNIWAINAGASRTDCSRPRSTRSGTSIPRAASTASGTIRSPPTSRIYNADFTEMTVKLRKGIFWSDGVEFTAADVVATVMTQIKNPAMRFSAVLANNVASVETPDPYTVVFKLKKPNSRFHANFTVRWGAIWILPKHVFEKVDDPAEVRLQQAGLSRRLRAHSFDPDGKWYIWQLRDDWQRTTLGRFGKPGPKYLAYVDPGPPDKRVIAQLNHELDVIHDIAPEGMFALAKQGKATRAWFKGFPYGHPDPTLPALIFNTQNEHFKNRDVRWALALLIDIKAVSMAAYRGAATISAIGVPPTGNASGGLSRADGRRGSSDFEVDTGKRKIKPYDPDGRQADRRHAAALDGRPDPVRSEGDRARPSAAAGGRPIRRPRRNCWRRPASPSEAAAWHHAGRQAVHGPRHGRGRPAAGDDPRRHDDRAAMEAGRHRCADRRRAGHAADAARRRRFRHLHRLERRDLGRPPGPVLLPR